MKRYSDWGVEISAWLLLAIGIWAICLGVRSFRKHSAPIDEPASQLCEPTNDD